MASKRILELEELGKRIAPALLVGPALGITHVAPPDPSAAPLPPAPVLHPLAGQGAGTYTTPTLNVDARPIYVLEGQAALAALLRVKVNGAVHGVAPGTTGNAAGTLTFTNAKGSVTIDLQGPTQDGTVPFPLDWQYKVSAATGAYQNLTDQGILRLGFKALPAPASPFAGIPMPQGIFKLVIASGHRFGLPPPAIPPTADSGVQGVAMVGPVMPVDQIGVPNTQPLPGAVISIQTPDGSSEITRVVADANGKFHISLPPGKYLLVPLPPQPGRILPRGVSQTFEVVQRQFTNVTVEYDSGIR